MNIHLKICENNVVHLGYDNLRVLNCLLLLEKFDCCFRDVHEEMNPNYTVKLCLQNFILIFLYFFVRNLLQHVGILLL